MTKEIKKLIVLTLALMTALLVSFLSVDAFSGESISNNTIVVEAEDFISHNSTLLLHKIDDDKDKSKKATKGNKKDCKDSSENKCSDKESKECKTEKKSNTDCKEGKCTDKKCCGGKGGIE